MSDIDRLLESGGKLGLSGSELLEFVKGEREREERLAREKREREDRLEKGRIERDERAHEREMRKLEIEREVEIARARASGEGRSRGPDCKAKLPKLPNFNEKVDSIDAYLRRFERFAESAKWHKNDWATHLSALLTSTALDVYSRMSVAESADYEKLKENLLKRFKLTEEGFREKFRKSTVEKGETACQFVVRLADYLDNWMMQAQVSKDYGGLRDLVLREQLLQSSGKGLQLFLRERKFSSVEEMAASADRYIEAHNMNTGPVARSSLKDSKSAEPGSRSFDASRGKSCFVCSGPHLMKDCPKKREKAAALIPTRGEYNHGQLRGGSNSYNGNYKRNFRDDQGKGQYKTNIPRKYTPKNGSEDDKSNLSACCLSEDRVVLNCGHELPVMSVACNDQRPNNMPEFLGKVGNKVVKVLRDTGCSTVVVKRSLVEESQLTGETQMCVLIDGTVRRFPTAAIQVSSPFFTGEVKAMCMESPVYDLIIGNIEGVMRAGSEPHRGAKREKEAREVEKDEGTLVTEDDNQTGKTKDKEKVKTDAQEEKREEASAVQTRGQVKREAASRVKPMIVPQSIDISSMNPDGLVKVQAEDETLKGAHELADTGEVKQSGKLNTYRYFRKSGVLFREFASPNHVNGQGVKQLVAPKPYRSAILKVAHESLFGGHLGTQKTADKIMAQFHWPGIIADVKRYCASCDKCQRTISKGKVKKVPLEQMPLIEVPFQRVAVDLVGPIAPASERGYRYILTVVDYATRYPEAVPLKNIETETVAEALMEMFTRVGVPKEVLSDQGTQFTSGLMKEVGRLLSMKQLTTTPYHAQCNGLVEKFNGTLKSIIKKLCTERPKDWDKFIAPALFAYREAPQASTGFSPFELLYGRTVRGPMLILKELMTKELEEPELKTVYNYVVDLRERLEDTRKLATEELKKSQERYKRNFDQRARVRTLKPGDKALVLLPTNTNKLLMQWRGPFEVLKRVGEVDYTLRVQGKDKTYHANMIKKYVERDEVQNSDGGEEAGLLYHVGAAVIEEESESNVFMKPETVHTLQSPETGVELPKYKQTEEAKDVNIGPNLTGEQKAQLQLLLDDFKDVLTDVPGRTDLVEHRIKVTSDEPIRSRPYPVPHALKETIDKEVELMLDMGVIEPSDSAYNSPVVVVRKSDGTNRFCIDFRKINRVTEFDAEPMSNQEDIFAKLNGCHYFSRIDLSKGYWQIPVAENSKKYTSFSTHKGLWQFKRMPFGLATAPGIFSRMMRKLLKGLKGVENFLDDIIIFTKTFEEHLRLIREVLNRLLQAGLTARPTKCMLAFHQLDFLGHKVSDGIVEPNPEKVEAIKNAKRPRNKTEVRSFLGMASFYRKFIKDFAALAAPLSDLTKKGKPNKVHWSSQHETAFQTLKSSLTNAPVLRMPDLERQFILRTDASNEGLGAVLLQETDTGKFPVAYASRKLLPREQNYSVVEKECLAVIWGIQKFHTFLYGKHFLLETDHMPLVYLNKAKESNGRLMRWALKLQAYRFTVVAIKGSDNVGADYLSRSSYC